MARHRSPGGRGTVSAYLSRPDAARGYAGNGSDTSSRAATSPLRTVPPFPTAPPVSAATEVIPAAQDVPAADPSTGNLPPVSAVPPTGARRGAHRRVPAPTVRGNTVVGATAALGAVVTGSFMAADPGGSGKPFEGANTHPAHLAAAAELAPASQPVRVQPAATEHQLTDLESVESVARPLAVPGDRVAEVDKRDVEALHKGEKLAREAAAAHAAAAKEAEVLAGGGDLDDWISVALKKMGLSQSLAPGVKKIIMAESRGNPKAINLYDSNARAGRPSQGLMQVIPSTFRAYVLPELRNRPITDPVANITAGVRYMIANYGLETLRKGGRSNAAGKYIGY